MSTFKIIKEIISDISGADEISVHDKLQNDIGLDSLGLVTLLIELEERFGIELDESDLNQFELTTFFDVLGLVNKYMEKSNEKDG